MKRTFLFVSLLLAVLGCSESGRPPAQAPAVAQAEPDTALVRQYERVRQLQQAQAADPVYQAEMLGKLSAAGLRDIQAGQSVQYFSHPAINSFFLGRLKARAAEWPQLHARQGRQQAAVARQEKATNAAYAARLVREGRQQRVAYARAIRTDFLDNDLDIAVRTDGPDAGRLTLTYVLFNAVSTRKLETGGGLAGHTVSEWREQGFTKVTLTDGYEYSASFTF